MSRVAVAAIEKFVHDTLDKAITAGLPIECQVSREEKDVTGPLDVVRQFEMGQGVTITIKIAGGAGGAGCGGAV